MWFFFFYCKVLLLLLKNTLPAAKCMRLYALYVFVYEHMEVMSIVSGMSTSSAIYGNNLNDRQ